MSEHGTPTVCVANAVDTLWALAGRAAGPAGRRAALAEAFAQQDQALFWRPTDKLIITEVPIAELAWQCDFLGLPQVSNLSPRPLTGNLFRDILADEPLMRALLDHAGERRRIRLIPHTTTAELWDFAEAASARLSIDIELPESSPDQRLRDLADTKSGLRSLVEGRGLARAKAGIAEGAVCAGIAEAVEVAGRMLAEGRPCIVKPDRGEASVGLLIVRTAAQAAELPTVLRRSPYFARDEPIVVEEWVHGEGVVFPSVEFVVEAGREPYLTHVCHMLFGEPTQVLGNVTSAELRLEPWYGGFVASASVLAAQLRDQGYRGHFGIDAVARPDGTLAMLDLNARRTGSTHLHDFGLEFFGADYQSRMTIGHYDYYGLPPGVSLRAVLGALDEVVCAPRDGTEGFVPCELTGLATGRLSSIIFAPTLRRFHELAARAGHLLQSIRSTPERVLLP
ncbi:ATP-grasp domain-containing protein [Dactylosporangium roseum]|uniref:ATP-grasp domain-containing protein n=1 Tax=Dactylosporangium roseum TaxID=47989 RepID=A0ABY5Z2H0_9ACTN|nr:ATP-grasp domain-containing protein [Dactylosporangium roseum]UWZ36205.1 ATP-grasp domain-containing protein [Dactylosporangium roseum]